MVAQSVQSSMSQNCDARSNTELLRLAIGDVHCLVVDYFGPVRERPVFDFVIRWNFKEENHGLESGGKGTGNRSKVKCRSSGES